MTVKREKKIKEKGKSMSNMWGIVKIFSMHSILRSPGSREEAICQKQCLKRKQLGLFQK